MNIDSISEKWRPRRKVEGIAAALLPFQENGAIAVDAFQRHLCATAQAGLMNAVNMDTGYVNYLTETEKLQVLRWTQEALCTSTTFVAGAYIEGQDGDVVSLYRRQMDTILKFDGIPILFQTARLHGKTAPEKIKTYKEICQGYSRVICFELGRMFAPNGEVFDEATFLGLMEIPEIKGIKHSSLDRVRELERLSLRDKLRPEFRIYTGNDLGISMIEYGSDYLLGLATLVPEKFAERDQLWAAGDTAYYALSDALQHLGNIAFREPIPAYKHSAAVFLNLVGRIPTPLVHPKNPQRQAWEQEIMADCARRLGYDIQGR